MDAIKTKTTLIALPRHIIWNELSAFSFSVQQLIKGVFVGVRQQEPLTPEKLLFFSSEYIVRLSVR